jgi:hypothetical protein
LGRWEEVGGGGKRLEEIGSDNYASKHVKSSQRKCL